MILHADKDNNMFQQILKLCGVKLAEIGVWNVWVSFVPSAAKYFILSLVLWLLDGWQDA